MAMMVSPEVAKLFQVLTGEEWPDANEDELRALAAEWASAAQALGNLGPGLRSAVQIIRSSMVGDAERAFAERVAPFVEGDNLIGTAQELFQGLADYLLELALDVEYMKLVIINSLIALLVEIAIAIKLSPFTGGASMAWLAARMAIVRFLLRTVLGRILLQIVQAAIFSIAFQLLIDATAQATQFAMGTRHEWNTKHTANAAGVGAMGAALALPMGALGKVFGGALNKLLDNALAKKFGKGWARGAIHNITEIGTEAFHEVLTEALYKYATTGEFEMNPYAATSGAISGAGQVGGEALGDKLSSTNLDGPGGGGGGGRGGQNGPTGNQPPTTGDLSGSDSSSGTRGGNGAANNGPANNGPTNNGSANNGSANNGSANNGSANNGFGNSANGGGFGTNTSGSNAVSGNTSGNTSSNNSTGGNGSGNNALGGNGLGDSSPGNGAAGNSSGNNSQPGSTFGNNGAANDGLGNNVPANSGPASNGPVNSGPFNNGPVDGGPVDNSPVNSGFGDNAGRTDEIGGFTSTVESTDTSNPPGDNPSNMTVPSAAPPEAPASSSQDSFVAEEPDSRFVHPEPNPQLQGPPAFPVQGDQSMTNNQQNPAQNQTPPSPPKAAPAPSSGKLASHGTGRGLFFRRPDGPATKQKTTSSTTVPAMEEAPSRSQPSREAVIGEVFELADHPNHRTPPDTTSQPQLHPQKQPPAESLPPVQNRPPNKPSNQTPPPNTLAEQVTAAEQAVREADTARDHAVSTLPPIDLAGKKARGHQHTTNSSVRTALGAKIATETARAPSGNAHATQAAADAATRTYADALSALKDVTTAITTTDNARRQATGNITDATNAAADATAALTTLREAVGNATTLRTKADTLTTQANQAAQNLPSIDTIDAQIKTIKEKLHTTDNPGRNGLEQELATLNNKRADITTAADLATKAAEAREAADKAAKTVTTTLDQINKHRDTAVRAGKAASTAHDQATAAVTAAEQANDKAKEAAKQGEVERGLTQLSFLPPDSRIEIETLGPRDALVDAITALTNQPRADVATHLDNLGNDELADAIDNGRLTVGDVTITVSADLYRPADSRTPAQHQRPAAVKTESSAEVGKPGTEATSSSVPIRIPLFFASPLDLVGTAVRPMVYVGVAGKRAQKFESAVTTSDSTSAERTSFVPATMSLTFSVPGRPAQHATISAGLRTPDITRAQSASISVPAGAYGELRPGPAVLPPSFRDVLGDHAQAGKGFTDKLLTRNAAPATVDVNGASFVVTPLDTPSVTLLGTMPTDSSTTTSLGNSWQTTKGSDATFGFGFYAGPRSWFLGGFADVSTGLTDGSTPGVDDSITKSTTDTELVYRIDRPMTVHSVGNRANRVQGDVFGLVRLSPEQARDLGLPLPEHLRGRTSVPAAQNDTRSARQRYIFGRDDIKSVRGEQLRDFVIDKLDNQNGVRLGDNGRAAVAERFSSEEVARNTVYDGMYGGTQVTWEQDGATHFADIYLFPVPPNETTPSGQTSSTTEVKHTDKFGRTYGSSRAGRVGIGGAYTPTATDSPNPDAPRATPAAGNPNPYQGGPTFATGAPRASLAVNVESGISNKSGYSGKDGRVGKYDGAMRDYKGPLELVIVHRSTANPNWAQQFFLGDRMLFGPKAADRLSGPSKADLDAVLADGTADGVHTGRVDDAITVSTPEDKLAWATKPLPQANIMTPGIYLGTPPSLPAEPITAGMFGEFANVEHVRITPNVTEGAYIALAKRIEPTGTQDGDGQPADGTVRRTPPKGSGTWPTWGQGTLVGENGTQYTYKHSDLTRPGSTTGNAVRSFIGRVGSHGTATQGFEGRSNSTGRMLREGRLTDFNGKLDGDAKYYAPRLVDIRPMSTLRRNQAGDQVAGSTKSWGVAADIEVSAGVVPKRTSGTGAMLAAALGGGGKYGRSHALDVTSGSKQNFEYKGPTAFVAFDTRYRYSADMNLRNMFRNGTFDDVAVFVDQPDGVLVELPVEHAATLFGDDVPPELTAALPGPKDAVTNAAHTLVPTANNQYASYSDTSVINSRLSDPNWSSDVETHLNGLGITNKEWQQEIVGQLDTVLNTPAGYVWLRDALAGEQGRGGLLSVPNPSAVLEDVADIRITAVHSDRTTTGPATAGLVPDKVTTSDYVSVSKQDKKSTVWTVTGAINAGVRHAETPAVPPGQPDANGTIQQSPPNAGASSGAFIPQIFGGSKSWKTDTIMAGTGTGSEKLTTQSDTDKVGRDTRAVTYRLDITRRRTPMPGFDTFLLGAPKHANWDKGVSQEREPITVNGEVDLVSPSSDVLPPLRKPAQQPTFELVEGPPPARSRPFGPQDGWRVVALGTDTVNAVHDMTYAQLSGTKLTGDLTAAQVADAAGTQSEYTRPGSNSEYILHNAVKGTSLHNAANTIFTGEYGVGRILSSKHPFYDALFDMTLTGDLRVEDLTFHKAVPTDTTMNLNQDRETATPTGTTKTTTTGSSIAVASNAANTYTAGGPAPTSAGVGPPASETVSNDKVTATSSKTAETTGAKYSGRSYLYIPRTATIYSDVHRYGSNWTHKPINAVKDGVFGRSHPPGSTMKVTSHRDMLVQVWENTALDKGLLTLGDVWEHAGKLPAADAPYRVTRTQEGATIHPPSGTGTSLGNPEGPRGRNLHVELGVSKKQLRGFVGSLPKDMRPVTYTVANGHDLTVTEVTTAVADLPEPGESTSDKGPSSLSSIPESEEESAETKPGQTDSLGAPWQPAESPSDPSTSMPAAPTESRANKRSRDVFEAEDGPVTTPEPRAMRPVPERVIPPSAQDVALLNGVVQSGERFANPATFVSFINGSRGELGRNVNCVDAALSFHSTYHGVPRVAGRAPGGVPRSAGTSAAEELGYAPELVGWGSDGLAEVIDRVTRGGHGSDAVVFGFPQRGQGHAWNIVNHHGIVSIVDAQAGIVSVAHPDAVPGLARVYAVPLDADDNFIPHHVEQDVNLSEFIDMDMVDLQPRATVTPQQANEFYHLLANATFNHPTAGELTIPTEHPEDGCYIRAHLWAQQLKAWRVDVRKVFIGRGGTGLLTSSANAYGATADTPRPVNWNYHVAPLISVDPGDGRPPELVVLDPAMGKGVVSVRDWFAMAGVTDGYDEADLKVVKPHPNQYQGNLADGEARVLVTDEHAMAPPWLLGTFPVTFDQATELVNTWLDLLRDYSIEATTRQEFRGWHDSLPPAARDSFNGLYQNLDVNRRRDFQEWFRSLGQDERAGLANRFGQETTAAADLVPNWADRVAVARAHLGNLSADTRATLTANAWNFVYSHHSVASDANLLSEVTDVVAYRYHTEGMFHAFDLSQRLATEHGTTIDLSLWTDLDLSGPAVPLDGLLDLDALIMPPQSGQQALFDFFDLGSGPSDALAGRSGGTGPSNQDPAEAGPSKRSRDTFEEEGPATTPEPPGTRPTPERVVPPPQHDVDMLTAIVPPGTRFTDPSTFVAHINGSRKDLGRDVNCVDAGLAFHSTYHGHPRVAGSAPGGVPRSAGTSAGEELGYAAELVGHGANGFAEVVNRITRAGHGADALVFGFPRFGQGHTWNVVNHHGLVSIVDAQAGTITPAYAQKPPPLDRVYAIPLDADGNFVSHQHDREVNLSEFLNMDMVDLLPRTTSTLDQANDYYHLLSTATFHHPTSGTLTIPTEHPEDGCYIRAHLWAQQLREWGLDVRKVFIGREGPGLVTQSTYAFGATGDTPQPISWRYHVAPLISVDLGNGLPPVWAVLDPAMNRGVVPVRDWIAMAGVTDGFNEADLYDVRPHPNHYQGPLAPGEARVLVTEEHAMAPPWLEGTFPATFDQATDLVTEWQDRTRDYSVEATTRREFRDWHASLPPQAKSWFNLLDSFLDNEGRRDFQDWFRSLGQHERAEFANRLGDPAATVFNLVPNWDDRVSAARTHLAGLSDDARDTARTNATAIIFWHHNLMADPALIDAITDVVAYRHHTEGVFRATDLSQRLAVEHGTTLFPPAPAAPAVPDPGWQWWMDLADLPAPQPPTDSLGGRDQTSNLPALRPKPARQSLSRQDVAAAKRDGTVWEHRDPHLPRSQAPRDTAEPVVVRSKAEVAQWFSEALREYGLRPYLSGGGALGFQQGSRPIKDLDFRVTADDAGFTDFNEPAGQRLQHFLNGIKGKQLRDQYHKDRDAASSTVPKGGRVDAFNPVGRGRDASRTSGSPNVLGHEVSLSVVPGPIPGTQQLSSPTIEVLSLEELRADKLRTMISRTKREDESVKKVAQDLFDFLDSMDLLDREAGKIAPDSFHVPDTTAGHLDAAIRERIPAYRERNLDGGTLVHLGDDDVHALMKARAVLTAQAHLRRGARTVAIDNLLHDSVEVGDDTGNGPARKARLAERLRALADVPVTSESRRALKHWMRHWNDPTSFGPPRAAASSRPQVRPGAPAGELPSEPEVELPSEYPIEDLVEIPADQIDANVRAAVPASNRSAEQIMRVLAFSDGFRSLPDSKVNAQTLEAFGLSKSEFSRGYHVLKSAGLVAPSAAGLSLTEEGWRLVPRTGPSWVLDNHPLHPPPDSSRGTSRASSPVRGPARVRPETPEGFYDLGQDSRTVLDGLPAERQQRLRGEAVRILSRAGWRVPLPAHQYHQAVAIVGQTLHDDGPAMAGEVAADLFTALTRPDAGPTDALGGLSWPAPVAPPESTVDDVIAVEPRPGKRSRDEFEADEGPVTTYEPPAARPVPERLRPPAPRDTAALLAVVPPGTRFADPASFVQLINGSRAEAGRDVNCVDAALAFHATYHGNPRVAGIAAHGLPRSAATAAAEELSYAPELFSRGEQGVAEVVARVAGAGHGADAVLFGFPRRGQGHAWNVVNHHGVVSIVDAQSGVILPADAAELSGLDRVYAIPVDAEGDFIADDAPPPTLPAGADPYAAAEHARAVEAHRIREAAAAGAEIPVPGTGARLVPSLGGLRLVGAAVTAELAAELATLSGRDVIALVIGPDAEEDERDDEPVGRLLLLRFSPRGRPELVQIVPAR